MSVRKYTAIIFWLGTVLLTFPAASAKHTLRVQDGKNSISIYSAGRLVLSYRYDGGIYKPYVKKLLTPHGINILRDNVPDHRHHHGLMFAVKVDGVNFWEERKDSGRQIHRRFRNQGILTHRDTEVAYFAQEVDWIDPNGNELLLKEIRTLQLCRLTEFNANLLTWQSELSAPEDKGEVTIMGRHYYGLGMRFVKSMDKVGHFFNAGGQTGEVFRRDERLIRAGWCCYNCRPNTRAVSAAMFDSAGNRRYPATWFTMAKPFAYLSATMALHNRPVKISEEKPLVLRYGLALWDGSPDAERIDSLYNLWMSWVSDEKTEAISDGTIK